jgi:hypothetical protein
MRSTIKELTKRKGRKRRYIRIEETLIVSEVSVVRTAKRLRRGYILRGTAAVAARLDITPALIR